MRKELKLSKNGVVKPPVSLTYADEEVQLLNRYIKIINDELSSRYFNGQELKFNRLFEGSEQLKEDLTDVFEKEGWQVFKSDIDNSLTICYPKVVNYPK